MIQWDSVLLKHMVSWENMTYIPRKTWIINHAQESRKDSENREQSSAFMGGLDKSFRVWNLAFVSEMGKQVYTP